MRLLTWVRKKLIGPHDYEKDTVVEQIDTQLVKLNGGTEKLSRIAHIIKSDREQSQKVFTDMLDSIVQESKKDAHR